MKSFKPYAFLARLPEPDALAGVAASPPLASLRNIFDGDGVSRGGCILRAGATVTLGSGDSIKVRIVRACS